MRAETHATAGREWARALRLVISLVGPGFALACLLISIWREPPLARLMFALAATAVTAVPFALYALFVKGKVMSLVTGLLLLILTGSTFFYSMVQTVEGRAGGAGGPFLWLGFPVVVVDCLVVGSAILVDAVVRSATARAPR